MTCWLKRVHLHTMLRKTFHIRLTQSIKYITTIQNTTNKNGQNGRNTTLTKSKEAKEQKHKGIKQKGLTAHCVNITYDTVDVQWIPGSIPLALIKRMPENKLIENLIEIKMNKQ